ncbi:1-aminocyclopropane-1-carboxylate oxidase homolog 4 [Linum perenne]
MVTTATSMISADSTADAYDRQKEVSDFDESKLGVKGLVESGISSIPRFFIHKDFKPAANLDSAAAEKCVIPTIDLSGVDIPERRAEIAEQISDASRRLGFFQVVNHEIPVEVLDGFVGAVRGFHELPMEEKAKLYHREFGKGPSFFSNIDLFHSQAASWRDTLQMRLGPSLPDLELIPEICRKEIIEWSETSKRVGELLMELLCEGLGLNSNALKEKRFNESRVMVGHYYPYCPQPDLTLGIASHTDPGALTLLLQDEVGGLQVKSGENWVDVIPVRGALVVNIGDLLQIMSNDEYKSVEHRVLANPSSKPRVSIAVFFNSEDPDAVLGPFPDLITDQKPAVYRQFPRSDYMRRFFTKELDGRTLTNFYKL